MGHDLAGRLGRNMVLALTIVFFGVPMLWLLLAPTKTRFQLNNDSPLSFGSASNVSTAWGHLFDYSDGIFNTWLINSMTYAVVSVVLALIAGVPAGYGLAKFRFRGRQTILILTLVTMIVPPAALVLPLYLEAAFVGLTNTMWAVILPLSFYPFGVYLVYLFAVNSIPDEIVEAARVDGAREWTIFFRIFMPLAYPVIVMVAFFAFISVWNAFFLPFIMNTDPGLANVQTGLQLMVRNTEALGGANMTGLPIQEPEVALAALISVTPILLIFIFAQRYLVAGQVVDAVKE